MPRIVADLGNSRLKWGLLDAGGRLARSRSLPIEDRASWARAWDEWNLGDQPSHWTIGSVNPPAAAELGAFLAVQGVIEVRWYRSAADVPIQHVLENPETAGADRALAVLAAIRHAEHEALTGPGQVVLCGTALTVERIGPDRIWQGGAIAAGLGLTARALHALTAQLPQVTPRDQPPALGNSTRPALEAGVFWGVAGAAREILMRQGRSNPSDPPPWLIWSGGDAEILSRAVDWPGATVIPDLVLHGLASAAYGAGFRL